MGYENMSTKLGSMAMGWKYADCLGLAASTASILDRRVVLLMFWGKSTKSESAS